MGDPFRRLFLDTLELILKKEPDQETLLVLLQLATPGLDESCLNNRSETKKIFRTLLTRVHPDKHPTDSDRATRLCHDVKVFYENCGMSSPEPKQKKRRKSGSPKSTAFPLEFRSREKWPHIDFTMRDAETQLTRAEVSCLVAYQCINTRGAIAHGKKISNKFSHEQAINRAAK